MSLGFFQTYSEVNKCKLQLLYLIANSKVFFFIDGAILAFPKVYLCKPHRT